jgi:hypothetical protein
MKIACVLTTIQVPTALAVYHKAAAGADVHFFVIGDRKTPDMEVCAFLMQHNIPNSYYSYDQQAELGYRCHDLIGPNSIQRRNIGFLEALKKGCDLIVSIDDDNLVLGDCYFDQHEMPFAGPFFGVAASSIDAKWFDVGQHLVPPARHRGFPIQIKPTTVYKPVHGIKIGASAGICLGDPDVDAVERMAKSPFAHGTTESLRQGLIVEPHTFTVFNSQNTAVLRKFIPAWGMVPFVGRFDDIYASLVCQRVMWEHGHAVHFGPPVILQQRNAHDLVKDLRGEIDGYDNILKFANVLDSMFLRGQSVIEDVRMIWQTLAYVDNVIVSGQTVDAMLAYIDDCERVM